MKNFKITRNLYNKIVDWKLSMEPDPFKTPVISYEALSNIPEEIKDWWQYPYRHHNIQEGNDRITALIRYLNGQYIFTIKKQKKFVVRNKGVYDGAVFGEKDPYYYVEAFGDQTYMIKGIKDATHFDSEFEAYEYKNSHQEVIEVEVWVFVKTISLVLL